VARHPGRILFGSFLLCEQEKGTRAPDARGKLKGRAHKKSWIDSPREYSLGKLTAQSACAGITD